ncbi:carbonic anhydrase [Sorangium cellulosum]|uniref:Carbonic anhydrase n=1 Tax=Sorangium cellulosum So0157-2 TaxID=1254432 RepID=S4XL30_SORCE|nr:carbonic anhydrase [Sorangium cellulosum So0157-2]
MTSSPRLHAPSSRPREAPISAGEALHRLREGNDRFAQNVRSVDTMLSQSARSALVAAQSPIAIVLSCSDARVPAELVFDQGLGDLFVVRVAGNVIAPTLVGSVEYAVAAFGTALVVVMGHTHCGAIAATLDWITARGPLPSEAIHEIVTRIRPAVEQARRPGLDRAAILAAATRADVRASVRELSQSGSLVEMAARGDLVIVGAEYSLATGAVDFFDQVPT